MKSSSFCLTVIGLAVLFVAGVAISAPPTNGKAKIKAAKQQAKETSGKKAMRIQYLEIVTPDVKETCEAISKAHGVKFSEPVAELGNARTADLEDGGRFGVRAPMRDSEKPIVRPYVLVDDIEAAVKAAEAAGAQVALPPMKLPGQGTFAIYILGGIEHGLWQL